MTDLVSIVIPAPSDPKARAQQALDAANAREITTDVDYKEAAVELQAIKAKWKEIDDQRKEVVKPIDIARKNVQKFFAGPLDFLALAETILKNKLVGYASEQERLRREEQRVAEEAARKERERLQREAAEVERKAREKAEADRRAAEEASAAGREEEARKLAARADKREVEAAAKADRLETTASQVVAPVIERAAPKVSGVTSRELWTFEINDEDKIPREYMTPNLEMIGKVVQATKGQVRIPGVRPFPKTSLAARKS